MIRTKDPHQNITRMLQRIDELRGSVLAVKGGGGKRLDSITASTAAPLEVTPLRHSKTAVASPEPTPGSKVIIRHIEHILEKHKKPTVRNPDHRGHISAARKAENALVEAWHNIEAEVDKTPQNASRKYYLKKYERIVETVLGSDAKQKKQTANGCRVLERRRDKMVRAIAEDANVKIGEVQSSLSPHGFKTSGTHGTSSYMALVNFGETCYLNALLQALLHASPASKEICNKFCRRGGPFTGANKELLNSFGSFVHLYHHGTSIENMQIAAPDAGRQEWRKQLQNIRLQYDAYAPVEFLLEWLKATKYEVDKQLLDKYETKCQHDTAKACNDFLNKVRLASSSFYSGLHSGDACLSLQQIGAAFVIESYASQEDESGISELDMQRFLHDGLRHNPLDITPSLLAIRVPQTMPGQEDEGAEDDDTSSPEGDSSVYNVLVSSRYRCRWIGNTCEVPTVDGTCSYKLQSFVQHHPDPNAVADADVLCGHFTAWFLEGSTWYHADDAMPIIPHADYDFTHLPTEYPYLLFFERADLSKDLRPCELPLGILPQTLLPKKRHSTKAQSSARNRTVEPKNMQGVGLATTAKPRKQRSNGNNKNNQSG